MGAAASPAQASGRTMPRRAAIASWIGSALEYYDFALYGTAAALVLNHLFFPDDAVAAVRVLLSMGTVGVAYVVRPLGALLMGPIGDRFGRRTVLILNLFTMGGATFAVGCLPTYHQVGLLAPILLVLCRLLQGLSASGEQASGIAMSLEHASRRHRALTTSWMLQGTQGGTLLAAVVFIPFSELGDGALLSWGWRIPFWFSAVVIVTAYLIRRKLEEPPAFRETQHKKGKSTPLTALVRFHKIAVARIAAAAMINTVNMVFTVYSVSYAKNGVGLDGSLMLLVTVVANLVALAAIPLSGALADRVGRKPIFIAGVLGPAAVMYPYLASISAGNWPAIFGFGALMSGLLYSMSNAVWPAFYAEMFPTHVRVTGLALGTQIGFAVSGGVAPALATIVAGEDMAFWPGPAIFVSLMCLLSAGAAITAKETAHRSLDEIDTVHTDRTERTEVANRVDLDTQRQSAGAAVMEDEREYS